MAGAVRSDPGGGPRSVDGFYSGKRETGVRRVGAVELVHGHSSLLETQLNLVSIDLDGANTDLAVGLEFVKALGRRKLVC